MVNVNDPTLPVVHIRIVCDEDSKKYPCDFCHRSFLSEKLLSSHVNEEHKMLDVQDVYVCSVCKSCLLTRRDLEEHITYRHQILLSENFKEECMVCEFCGMQLAEICHLKEHIELYHALEYLQKGFSFLNLVELSLKEVWSMGVDNTDCKTLFKILEIPVSETDSLHGIKSDLKCESNAFSVNLNSPGIVSGSDINDEKEIYECEDLENKNIMLISDNESAKVNIVKGEFHNSDLELDVCDSDIVSVISIKDDEKLGLQTLKCKSGKQVITERQNQLILTVESKAKVKWSTDMVSKVLSSCSILKENKPFDNNSEFIIEKLKAGRDKIQEGQICVQIDDIFKNSQNSKGANLSQLFMREEQTDKLRERVGESCSLARLIKVSEEIDEELIDRKASRYYTTSQPICTAEENEEKKGSVKEILIELSNDDNNRTTILEQSKDDNRTAILCLSNDNESMTTILELSGVDDCQSIIHESSEKSMGTKQQRTFSHEKDTDSGRQNGRRKDCCICGMRFSNYQMLEKHESEVHDIRIKCDFCDDTFTHSKSLRTHYMRKHANNSNFQCEICQKMFKSRSNLWTHHQTHLKYEARRFECTKCPLRYHTRSKLNNHFQSHSGKKKYQCGECERGFLYPSILLKHMEKHFTEAHKDLTENESLYLVEVEVQDTDIPLQSTSAKVDSPQPLLPSTSS